jgi:S1-C subfamily serine protease
MPNQSQHFHCSIARIYSNTSQQVVGTGFLVADGIVLTCAHVAALALLNTTSQQEVLPEGVVELDFPCYENRVGRDEIGWTRTRAKVAVWFPVKMGARIEDIAGLKLFEPWPTEIRPIELNNLNPTNLGDPLEVRGFREGLSESVSSYPILRAENGFAWLQIEGDREQGYFIEPGFSGAPVLDLKINQVIGMTVARDKQRLQERVAFAIPNKTLIRALEQWHNGLLVEILNAIAQGSPTLLNQAFEFCQPELLTRTLPRDSQVLVTQLSEMKPGDAPYSPLKCFVAYLVVNAVSESDRLVQWLEQSGRDVQALLDWVRMKIEEREEVLTVGEKSFLLVQILKDSDNGYYDMKGWFIPNTETCQPLQSIGFKSLQNPRILDNPKDINEAKKLLRYYLDECGNIGYEKLILEFILSKEELCIPVETWEISEEGPPLPIGIYHPVVVRSVERIQQPRFKQIWREKWRKLTNRMNASACDVMIPIQPVSWECLTPHLMKSDTLGFCCHWPPSDKFGNDVAALYQFGIPVAVWLRRSLAEVDLEKIKEEILECPIEELIEKIYLCRQSAFQTQGLPNNTDSDLVGHHLSLLWEDFNRIPPSRSLSNARL